MNDQEYHDLLIRIDTKLTLFEASLKDIETRVSASRPCDTHAEKIRTLENITWGALLIAIASVVKSFWGILTK